MRARSTSSLNHTLEPTPVEESYGTVAVFLQDLYGNLWDLLQLKH
jgi:hypothetical protein